jgi:hypothetical protein
MYKCKAVLAKDIEYSRLSGEIVSISKGTEIEIDTQYENAIFNGDTFDIHEDEYELLYLN